VAGTDTTRPGGAWLGTWAGLMVAASGERAGCGLIGGAIGIDAGNAPGGGDIAIIVGAWPAVGGGGMAGCAGGGT
jgi:hypothetical protein